MDWVLDENQRKSRGNADRRKIKILKYFTPENLETLYLGSKKENFSFQEQKYFFDNLVDFNLDDISLQKPLKEEIKDPLVEKQNTMKQKLQENGISSEDHRKTAKIQTETLKRLMTDRLFSRK